MKKILQINGKNKIKKAGAVDVMELRGERVVRGFVSTIIPCYNEKAYTYYVNNGWIADLWYDMPFFCVSL